MYLGELVRLRAVETTDLDDFLKFHNTLELRRTMGPPMVRSRRHMEEWLQKATVRDPWKDGELSLVIEEIKTHEFLGFASLSGIVLPQNRGELGISIYNPANRGKGYGTDALLVLLSIGFNILGLNSIFLETMEDNDQSIRVYEKIGFKRVGILRETEFMDGAYKGLLIMDILRREFLAKYPAETFNDSD
jgi:RimJ/RimL family protein N-acetyltransferase